MDAREFLNMSEHETTTAIIAKNITNSFISNKYVDPMFNKYAIIGALIVFTSLFLASVFYHYMKTDTCCRDEHGSHLYNVVSDDASSFMDDDDEADERFLSCQLYVDDPEVNTASGVEYDCRSIDTSSTEEERISLMSQNQRRYEAFHSPDPCAVHTLS